MKNKNSVVLAISFVLVAGFGMYIGNIMAVKGKGSVSDLYASKSTDNAKRFDEFQYPLMKFRGKDLYLVHFPNRMQVAIIQKKMEYNQTLNELIKSFAVQYTDELKKDEKLKSTNLPDLITTYRDLVSDEDAENVYQKNINKFEKGHNKAQIIVNIKIQMLMNRIVKKTNTTSKELEEKGVYSSLIKGVKIAPNFLEFPGAPTINPNKKAKVQVKILMNYTCANCKKLTKEIGELIKKYDSSKFSISLIHYSHRDLDLNYYFNKAALCVNKQNAGAFWRFNLDLLNLSPRTSLFKTDDLDKGKEIIDEVLKHKNYTDLNKKDFNLCLKNEEVDKKQNKKSPISRYLTTVRNDLAFLRRFPFPIIFINGRKSASASKTILQSVEAEVVKED